MTGANAATIAALLRLADGTPLAGALRLTMRESLLDDDPTDRAAAFGALYARFGSPRRRGHCKNAPCRSMWPPMAPSIRPSPSA